ncbi:MAG: response regulator transcription factor [Acidobacteria bacterium]|nr:response regulator transcription factor [Acidobacteriota bacterium]
MSEFQSRSSDGGWSTHTAQASIRVLTVDQHALVREGIAAILNRATDLRIVAEAATGEEAIAMCRDYRPDIVTLDLVLPDMTGAQAVRRILDETPGVRVVAVTAAPGDISILRALEAGVRGLVLKAMAHGELPQTLRQVHAGRKVIPRQVASKLAEYLGDEGLTRRELQVLELVAQGNRNKQIAGLLSIADETVRMHMKNILGKLRANDRTHAVTIALARGFFPLHLL